MSLAQIKGLVPNSGALVLPAISSLGTSVFVFTGDTSHDLGVLLLPTLTSRVTAEWLKIFRAGDSALYASAPSERASALRDFQEALLELGKEFWVHFYKPIIEFLRTRYQISDSGPLTVITHGDLDALPIHTALRTRDGRLRFLIEDRVLRFAPGLYSLLAMHQSEVKRKPRPPSIAAFINPTGDLTYGETVEWPLIRSLAWDGASSEHIGSGSATMSAITSIAQRLSQKESFTHLHFITHGQFDADSPESSGILLSSGQGEPAVTLTVLDVLRLPRMRGLELVCLSTCQSALSDVSKSTDEFIGMTTAFILAGAGSILGTLYSIRESSAAVVMSAVYGELLATRSLEHPLDVAEAFQKIVVERLRSDPGQEHKNQAISLADWAAFRPVCR